MNTSRNKIQNKKSSDAFDVLIHEKGLRIKKVIIDKKLDLIVMILSNGFVLKENISEYDRLKNAGQQQLNNFRLIGKGIGISWERLNEDLSLKGFLRNSALHETLRLLEGKSARKKIIA